MLCLDLSAALPAVSLIRHSDCLTNSTAPAFIHSHLSHATGYVVRHMRSAAMSLQRQKCQYVAHVVTTLFSPLGSASCHVSSYDSLCLFAAAFILSSAFQFCMA